MELIGTGAFTKVYKINSKRVFVKSVCPVKECIALGWFPSTHLFPTIERVDYQEYEMEYFPKVTSLKNNLKPEHWALYKELRKVFNDYFREVGYCENDKIRKSFKKHISNRYYRSKLLEAVDALGNYGDDFGFEISPRNIAVKNGSLILLDVFFCRSTLRNVRGF